MAIHKETLSWLAEIRKAELEEITNSVGGFQGRVLEIGGGTGWQAAELQKKGVDVTSIELANSNYAKSRVFPIIDYDGHNIPFADQTFDVIFSSNVLEHVPHIDEFLSESMRVLKVGGCAVHVMPSHIWRLWSNVTHYVSVFQKIAAGATASEEEQSSGDIGQPSSFSKFCTRLKNAAIPARHGERGNFLTEVFYFRPVWWLRRFQNSGWRVDDVVSIPLFYSGYMVLGKKLGLRRRRQMAHLLGSASTCFILTKIKQS